MAKLYDWNTLPNPASGLKWGAPGQPWTAVNPATGQSDAIIKTPTISYGDDSLPTQAQWGFLGENPGVGNIYGYGPEPAKPKDNKGTTLGLASVFAAPFAAWAGGALAGAGSALPAEVGGSAALGMTGADVLAGGAGAATGGSMAGTGDFLGSYGDMAPNYSMGSGSDIYGNFDMGYGSGGTSSAVPSSAGGLDSVIQQVNKIPGGSNILSRIMNGSATTEDWVSAAGKLLATGLGIYGSNQQAGALKDLAGQYNEFGAPSRARFQASMTPGFDPLSIPGYAGALDTTSKALLARLSASGGNPFGNPGGLIEANKQIVSGTALPAIQNYQALNANTGFGQAMNGAMQLQQQAIGAQSGGLDALGYGLNALTSQQSSIPDWLRQITGGTGFKLNDGSGLA